MYSEDDLIPLSAVQHILFCERQCALIHLDARYQRLIKAGMKGVAARALLQYRQFCFACPLSWQALSGNSHDGLDTVLIRLFHPDSAFFATGWENDLAILWKTSIKGGKP